MIAIIVLALFFVCFWKAGQLVGPSFTSLTFGSRLKKLCAQVALGTVLLIGSFIGLWLIFIGPVLLAA